MPGSLPLAPIPVGVVDGSLHPSQVEDWSSEQQLLSPMKTSVKDVGAALSSCAAANDLSQLTLLCASKPPPKRSSMVDALCHAAGAGSITTARYLLTLISVNETNRTGRTALHWACRNGQTAMCQMLVEEYEADVGVTTKDGITCVAWAVWGGNLQTVKWAVGAGCDPWMKNRWGCGLIHWAAAGGNLPLCRYLQDELGLDFGLKNNQGHNGLSKACWNNHQPLCEMLLFENHGIDQQQFTSTPSSFPQVIKMLQEEDRAGLRAFEIAKTNGNIELSKWLLTLTEATESVQKVEENCLTDGHSVDISTHFPAAFVVYYRTQQIVPLHEWNLLLYKFKSDLPVFLRPIGLLATNWTGQKFDALPKGNRLRLAKSTWLQDKRLRNQCLHLEKAGMLRIERNGAYLTTLVVHLLKLSPEEPHKTLYIKCAETAMGHVEGILNSGKQGVVLLNDFNAKLFIANTAACRTTLGSSRLLLSVSNPTKFPCLFGNGLSDAQVLFDRVIVQPDTSRDGEFRSNPHMIPDWSMTAAVKYHSHCKKLLFRGLHNLEVGGRLVYTTSSLNPLENEAVVLSALKRFKGTVQLVLVDAEDRMHTSAGLLTWAIPDKTMLEGKSLFRFLQDFSSVPTHDLDIIRESFFSEGGAEHHLERCLRVHPLVEEDSDACFVAVFTKLYHEPAIREDWVASRPDNSRIPETKHERHYVPLTEAIWVSISQFYGITCGKKLYLEYMCGRAEPTSICLLEDEVAAVAQSALASSKIYTALAGVRLFEPLGVFLAGCSCRWRPVQSGLEQLTKMCAKRVLPLQWIDREGWIFDPLLKTLLKEKKLDFKECKAFERLVQHQMCPGGMMLEVHTTEAEVAFHLPCVLTATQILMHADKRFVEGLRVFDGSLS